MSAMLIAMTMFFTACSEDSGGTYPPQPAPTITISGTVMDDTNASIENAQVVIVNIQTQQNALDPFYTNVDGKYSFDLPSGTYEVRVQAQGYEPSPPAGVIGIPIAATSTFDVMLEPISGGPYGSLKLDLVNYSNSVGALVILKGKTSLEEFSAVSSISGDLMMYNLPVEDYNLSIQTVGHSTYNSDSNVSIADGVETLVDYIELTAINGYTVSGTVSFLAVENAEVDVSLTDPKTGDVIPGTDVFTSATNYSIAAVAPGRYYIRATYKVDGYVVDPDSIVKHGEPEVTVVNIDVPLQNIDVTGAVALTSPIAEANGVAVEITDLTPTLTWEPYPATVDYVLEVFNESGDVIWGGFADDENLTRQVLVPKAETSVVYNSDGQGQALEVGKYYRWKVYSSVKYTPQTGDNPNIDWKLQSSSEEAQGVFKVVAP